MSSPSIARVLDLGSAPVEARLVKQDIYSFGKTVGKRQYLTGPAALGFLNAAADLMDGIYAFVEPGFHSKFQPELVALEIAKSEFRAYVNFDIASSERIAWLAKFGILPIEGQFGWLSLDTNMGRIFSNSYAHPQTRVELFKKLGKLPENYDELSPEEQREARNAAELSIHPSVIQENDHEWSIVHKENGMTLLQLVMSGTLTVTLDLSKNNDGLRKGAYNKFLRLFGPVEDRVTARQTTVNRMRDSYAMKRDLFYSNRYPERAALRDEVVDQAGGISVFWQEQIFADVNPTKLVGVRIQYHDGKTALNRRAFIKSVEAAREAMLTAVRNNWNMVIEYAPANFKLQ